MNTSHLNNTHYGGAMTTTDYVIYTIANCKPCQNAKDLLRDNGVGFHDVAVDIKPALATIVINKTGRKTWPQVFYKGKFIGGYVELAQHFNEA